MKICITSIGNNLDSLIDPQFGRCKYFIIWDDSSDTFEAIANPNIEAESGAGIQAAQLVITKGASVVVTGEVGPKAGQLLNASGLKIISDAKGPVKERIEKYCGDIDGNIGIQDNRESKQIKPKIAQETTRECFGIGNKRQLRYGNREEQK